MKNKKLLIGIGIIAVLAIVGIGIYKNHQHTADEKVVRIGAILPLTGYGAHNADMVRKGLDLAAKQLSNNGVRFDILYEDSKSSPKEAITAFKRLESDGIKYLIVLGGPLAMAVAPFTKGQDVILFGLATTEAQFVNISDRSVRISPSVEEMARVIASYDYNILGKKTAAIVFISQEYGQTSSEMFQAKFEGFGGRVVVKESYDITQRDFRDIISKIKAANPDVIHLIGVGESLSTFVRQCFEDTIVRDIQISGDMTFAIPNLKASIGHIFKEIFYVDGVVDDAFLSSYDDEFSTTGCSYEAYAYVIPSLIYEAEMGNVEISNANQVMRFIKKEKHKTVFGELSFGDNGEANFQLHVNKLSDDGIQVVSSAGN